MRRFALPGLITLVVAGLLAVLAFGVADSGPSKALDAEVARGAFPPAPSAQLPLPLLGSSRTESVSDLRGHVVMVSFLAGWCDACQADAPVVERAQQMLQKVGGTVLGVTFQDSSADATSYMRRYHLAFPVLRDANGQLANAYGVTGPPETFIVSAQGRIVALRRYQLTSQWVSQTLGKLLGRSA